jgi:hypothetical protein
MAQTTPFTPSRDDGRALYRVVYDYIVSGIEAGTLRPGAIIPHSDLAAELEVDFPSSAYYQAIGRATKELQGEHHRSLVVVRGAGYQLIDGMAMVDKGRGYKAAAGRTVGKAVAVVKAVSEDDVPAERDRYTVRQVKRGMEIIASVLAQQEERLAEHDRELDMLKAARLDDRSRIRATEEDVSRILEKLREMDQQR